MHPLRELTITQYARGLRTKEFSALEVVQAFFKHIKETDTTINAYLALNEEGALRDAEAVDIALARGEACGALAGVPLAIKDNILVKDLPATAGSKVLETYTASYDAGVIEKLKREKAIFLGKTNLDEFAMGSSTENSAFAVTKNPHDLGRVPGGSSGGSAAAVAAHLAVAALGSDTGGSIREPASFCGVVGLKPTYGAVSRSGLIAMASSLDQIGPLTKSVEDAALLYGAIRGYDPYDATSTSEAYSEEMHMPTLKETQQLTVGLPKEYFIGGISEEVTRSLEETRRALQSLGIKFKEISLPHTKYALSAYYIIMPAEVSANLARFDGIRYTRPSGQEFLSLQQIYLKSRSVGFGEEVKRRIILGTFVLSSGYYDAYYEKAQRVRRLIADDFEQAFQAVDVIFTPVAPTQAFPIGEKIDDPLAMYLSDVFTIPVNLAGLPAISIPVRNPSLSLPVGFQLIGKHFREADLLGIGHSYETLST